MKVLLLGIALISLCYSAESPAVDQALEEQQAAQYTAIHRVRERATVDLTEPLLRREDSYTADNIAHMFSFNHLPSSLSEVTVRLGSIFSTQLLLSTSHVTATAVAGAPPPPPRDDFFRGISLEQPFLHFLRFDGNYLSGNLSNFLEYLYRSRFFEFSVFRNTHYYDNLIRILLDSAPAPVHDVASQEALTAGRERVRDDYVTMATEGPSATAIARHLPSPDAVDAAFGECFSNLNDLYYILLGQKTSDAIKFRFENAKRTLALIDGDASIEHHPISSVDRYSTYSYDGLPNVRQLLVLACRLSKVDLRDFVESSIAVHCDTPAKWQAWRRPFTSNPRFNDVLSYEDFGQSLNADREHGSPFINSIVRCLERGEELPAPGTAKIMMSFGKALLMKRTEQLMPVTEALFMVMRGHNVRLLDATEPNHPACAEGAYLGVLKSISEMTPGLQLFSSIALEDCHTSTITSVVVPA